MKSLRSLIRLSAIILMTGLIVISSVLIYTAGDALVRRFLDGRLLGLAGALAKIIEQYPNLFDSSGKSLTLATKASHSNEQHELQEVVHTLRVFSAEGRLIWNGSGTLAEQPVSDQVFERVRLGNDVWETVESVDGTPVRRLFLPIPQQGPVRYVLLAEASLQLYREVLNGLVLILILGSGIILVLVWVGTGWLAKKILTPAEVVNTVAETMSEPDLEKKRLTVDSPYEEFRPFIRALNSMIDRFQRSVESQQRFVEHAAHEIQTPLTVLQGNLEVALLKARTAEEYREALINNLEQVGQLIALTRSLLTLANFAGNKPPVHLAPLALEPLIQELLAELAILFDERCITLSFKSEPVPPVLGDAQWLKRALINLLDNALRYTPSGGAVTIRLQTVGEGVSVTVEDTGHGIESEHLPHLFERFYRTDWARMEDAGGTGLGLPIVREIMEAHGGSISVISQIDKGSIFTLHLPIPTHATLSV